MEKLKELESIDKMLDSIVGFERELILRKLEILKALKEGVAA